LTNGGYHSARQRIDILLSSAIGGIEAYEGITPGASRSRAARSQIGIIQGFLPWFGLPIYKNFHDLAIVAGYVKIQRSRFRFSDKTIELKLLLYAFESLDGKPTKRTNRCEIRRDAM
jgi:hypothetical protein